MGGAGGWCLEHLVIAGIPDGNGARWNRPHDIANDWRRPPAQQQRRQPGLGQKSCEQTSIRSIGTPPPPRNAKKPTPIPIPTPKNPSFQEPDRARTERNKRGGNGGIALTAGRIDGGSYRIGAPALLFRSGRRRGRNGKIGALDFPSRGLETRRVDEAETTEARGSGRWRTGGQVDSNDAKSSEPHPHRTDPEPPDSNPLLFPGLFFGRGAGGWQNHHVFLDFMGFSGGNFACVQRAAAVVCVGLVRMMDQKAASERFCPRAAGVPPRSWCT